MKHTLNVNNIYELKRVLLKEDLVVTIANDSVIEDCLCDYIYDFTDVKEYLVDLYDINNVIINYIDFEGLIDESTIVNIGDDRYLNLDYILDDKIQLVEEGILRDIDKEPIEIEFDFVDYADLINKHDKEIEELKKQVHKLIAGNDIIQQLKFPRMYKKFDKCKPEDLK